MPEVSPVGGAVLGFCSEAVFVRVNQVLVRLWALPPQCLTGRFGVHAVAMVFRGDCCVLSEE